MMRSLVMISAVLIAFGHHSSTQATTIYQHDFLGSDTDPLDGEGVEGGTASGTLWVAEPAWFADGHAAVGADEFDSANAILPFAPVAGNQYTLSATLTASGNTFNYLTLGFMNNPTVDTLSDEAGGPWMLKRGQQAGFVDDIYSALDSTANGLGDLAFHGQFPGATTLSMQLDTEPAVWTVEYFINDISVRGPVGIDTITTPITHVGISRYVSPVTGAASSFSLTQVPEPSMLGLACVGLFGCLSHRVVRRRGTRTD